MSADNGIYILTTPDGNGGTEYRVAHCQAIDNLDFKSPNGEGNALYVFQYFNRSPVFMNLKTAYRYAEQLHREAGWTEYGICEILYPKSFDQYKKEVVPQLLKEMESIVSGTLAPYWDQQTKDQEIQCHIDAIRQHLGIS